MELFLSNHMALSKTQGSKILSCLHPEKPSVLVYIDHEIFEYDLYNGFVINSYAAGSVTEPTGISIGKINTGQTFLGIVDKTCAFDVYNYDYSSLFMSYPGTISNPKPTDTAFISITNCDKSYAVVASSSNHSVLVYTSFIARPMI